MDLTNEDVADILALLDSLPYDELDLQTPRFRLTLRRAPEGWTRAVETRAKPTMVDVPPTEEVRAGWVLRPLRGVRRAWRRAVRGKQPQRWNIGVALAAPMFHRCRRMRSWW